MLVALLEGNRIGAAAAQKGPEYRCPGCKEVMTLKKGRMVIHHFAHQAPVRCSWARGETLVHMESKELLSKCFVGRGLRTESEFVVESLFGDRRADLMLWSPNGNQVAFEMQHTPISIEDIERRADAYAKAGIGQIWIPFIRSLVWERGSRVDANTWRVEEYPARPFEKWVHGFNMGMGMWMYDPQQQEFWHCKFSGHLNHVETKIWYSEGGEENYSGGYSYWSRRHKELTLEGPHKVESLKVKTKTRNAFSAGHYSWPAGKVGHFVV